MINEIVLYIMNKDQLKAATVNTQLVKLKKLRISADYKNESFDGNKASRSLSIMNSVLSILNQYLS